MGFACMTHAKSMSGLVFHEVASPKDMRHMGFEFCFEVVIFPRKSLVITLLGIIIIVKSIKTSVLLIGQGKQETIDSAKK